MLPLNYTISSKSRLYWGLTQFSCITFATSYPESCNGNLDKLLFFLYGVFYNFVCTHRTGWVVTTQPLHQAMVISPYYLSDSWWSLCFQLWPQKPASSESVTTCADWCHFSSQNPFIVFQVTTESWPLQSLQSPPDQASSCNPHLIPLLSSLCLLYSQQPPYWLWAFRAGRYKEPWACHCLYCQ